MAQGTFASSSGSLEESVAIAARYYFSKGFIVHVVHAKEYEENRPYYAIHHGFIKKEIADLIQHDLVFAQMLAEHLRKKLLLTEVKVECLPKCGNIAIFYLKIRFPSVSFVDPDVTAVVITHLIEESIKPD